MSSARSTGGGATFEKNCQSLFKKVVSDGTELSERKCRSATFCFLVFPQNLAHFLTNSGVLGRQPQAVLGKVGGLEGENARFRVEGLSPSKLKFHRLQEGKQSDYFFACC